MRVRYLRHARTGWVEVDPAAKMLRLISRISGRAFVGDELYRNEEWIDISCKVCKLPQLDFPSLLY